jgi:hypothetical protein
MKQEDLTLVLFYGLSTLIISGYNLYKILTSKSKTEISDSWLYFIAGLTPGVMLITGFFIIAGFIWCMTELPTKLIYKLKNL